MRLLGVFVAGRVGDELRVRRHDGVDDLEAGGPQRPAGLRAVDDAVDDVGHLGLGGAVAQADVGLDALLLEEPPRELGVLRGHPHALREVFHPFGGIVARDRHHDAERLRGGLRVLQLTERDDLAGGLLDPVASGDSEIEEPLGDVRRDLLGSQDPHLVDPRIVDRGLVVDIGRAADGEVGGVEQFERRFLERPLREDQLQHGRQSPAIAATNLAISTAVRAPSSPAFSPPGVSERASAWSRFSVVSTPKTTGTPVSRATRRIPAAAWPATCSKWAVSPRITHPRQMTASTEPESANTLAASGSSNAPGTHTSVMSP